ncbi:hypothetical protein LEMLEM_LOCUS21739, partial [Lemmus lemmus]
MSASGNTNLLQEDDGHQRSSLCSLLAIWERNYSCLDCCMVCYMNWTCRTH